MLTISEVLRFLSLKVTDPITGCWNWIGTVDAGGYGRFCARGRPCYTYRIAFQLWNSPVIPKGMHVNHKCNNRRCCNPDHLELVTPAGNSRYIDECGRRVVSRGERNGRAKLTDAQVKEMRALYREGLTQTSIAKRLGVSQPLVSLYINDDSLRAPT